jgi:glycosyltransferase involved in cell wall biosynthesis
MKVAYLLHNTFSGRLGGADRSFLALLDEICARGVEPLCIAPRESAVVEECRSRGFRVVIIPYPNNVTSESRRVTLWISYMISRLLRRRRTLQAASAISQLLTAEGVEIVHSNSMVIAAGSLAARHSGLPHVWHIREILDINAKTCDWAPAEYLRMIDESTRCIVISDAVRRRMEGKGNVSVVYNGILTRQRFAEVFALGAGRRSGGRRAGQIRLVVIGGIHQRKGQDLAVRALARVRSCGIDAMLEIVGEGDRKWIEHVIREEGQSSAVLFVGATPEPWDALMRADALLMCSEAEAMGRVTVEAMAAGVLVIGRRTGATPELIEDVKTGLLYDDESSLTGAIEWAVNNPNEVIRITNQAFETALRRFSREEYGSRVLDLYDEATNK